MRYLQRLPLGRIRKEQYEYHKDHDRSLYTWIKACFYMESASLLVWVCQKKIHPTVLTAIYGLLGVSGGVLLAIPQKEPNLIALVIFYVKAVFDWADGHLARINNQITDFGDKLDRIAGRIGTIAFYLGLGFYLGHKTTYYAIPYVLILTYILHKAYKLQMNRAWVMDSIILFVGIDIFLRNNLHFINM